MELNELFIMIQNKKLDWKSDLQILNQLEIDQKIILYAGTYSFQEAIKRPYCENAQFYFYTVGEKMGYCFYINPMGVGIKYDNDIFKFSHRRLYKKSHLTNCFFGEPDMRSGEYFKRKNKR